MPSQQYDKACEALAVGNVYEFKKWFLSPKSESVASILGSRVSSVASTEVNEFSFNNVCGETLLYMACSYGNLEIVRILLECDGIDVNKGQWNQDTPLFAACSNGHVEIVKLLLASKAIDVNKGASPLKTACTNGHLEIVELLLQAPKIKINYNLSVRGKSIASILEYLEAHNNLTIQTKSPTIKQQLGTSPKLAKSLNISAGKKQFSPKTSMNQIPKYYTPKRGNEQEDKENYSDGQQNNENDPSSDIWIAQNERQAQSLFEKERLEKELTEKKRKERIEERVRNANLEKEKRQSFQSTFQIFAKLCSLNENVSYHREQFNSQMNSIISLSHELTIKNVLQQKYFTMNNRLNSCFTTLTSLLGSVETSNITQIEERLATISNTIEVINSESYVIRLNDYYQMLGEKLQIFNDFIANNLDVEILQNSETSDSPQSIITIQESLESVSSSLHSNNEIHSLSILQNIIGQLQSIIESLNTGSRLHLRNFSKNLMNATQILEKERLELEELTSNTKNLIPKEIQFGIYDIYCNYQNQFENCEKLIKETIPFIMERYEHLQNIVHTMRNYKPLSDQFTSLQRRKARVSRELKIIKLAIDGLKEELIHVTDRNEYSQIEEEIKEKEKALNENKQSLKGCIEQTNEIKLKFLHLKAIGINTQPLFTSNIISNVDFEEMSPELFKEIKPIKDWNGNHDLFIGTDINDKKHIIKQYSIKDNKKMESLQKEMKITTKLKHFNIIEIEGFYISNDNTHSTENVFIVMPLYSNGNLKEFIGKQRKLDLNFWERTWRQLLIAIQHIHSRGVVHCDIKPENIFVGDCNNGFYPIILGDFDISMDVQSRTTNLYTRTAISGTFDYLAPELMNGESASFKSDMFAFGKTIKNCMNNQELTNYQSLNNLIQQCLSTDPLERPYASDALVCEFFFKDTLIHEVKIQEQAKSLSAQSSQLKDYEKQLNTLKSNVKKEQYKLQQEIRKLEWEKREFSNQNASEKQELSQQIAKLKNKEKRLEEMQSEMEQTKSRQLNIVLPSYWHRSSFHSYSKRYYITDVTNYMKNTIQEIMNASCNSSTLGLGLDQQMRMNYSRLVVSSVARIENSTLFTSYKSRMNNLASYQDSPNPIQVQTEQLFKTSKAMEWMKTVGLNSGMNEKYLWHGTKPDFIQTIAEHGFDERVASLQGLFGAGVYFAEYCSKSDQYCTPDHNYEFSILLCRVVLGRKVYFTPQQMNNQRRPPEIAGTNRRVFDSVVGKSTTYREFIVYDRYQCYPEYIIKYKRL